MTELWPFKNWYEMTTFWRVISPGKCLPYMKPINYCVKLWRCDYETFKLLCKVVVVAMQPLNYCVKVVALLLGNL